MAVGISREGLLHGLQMHPCPRFFIVVECPCSATRVVMCWQCVDIIAAIEREADRCACMTTLQTTVDETGKISMPRWRPIPRLVLEAGY